MDITPTASETALIQSRLDRIFRAISDCVGEGKPPTLMAVTKYATLPQMVAAYQCGVRDFGENKVQDALEKMAALPQAVTHGVRWHLIGPLQRNKINKTLGRFALLHAIDSVELAEAVSLRNVNANFTQPVLLQVNVSKEPTKHGFAPDEVPRVYEKIRTLKGLLVQGLMTMAPHTSDSSQIKAVFHGLKTLQDSLEKTFGDSLPERSMGMSQDYIHAIGEGATILRIGSAIFG